MPLGKEEPPLNARQIDFLNGADQPSRINQVVEKWVKDQISPEEFAREVQKEAEQRYREIMDATNSAPNGNGHANSEGEIPLKKNRNK